MCLQTNQKEPSITEEDRVVYKILSRFTDNTAHSIWYHKVWQLGKLYTEEIKTNLLKSYADGTSGNWLVDTFGKDWHLGSTIIGYGQGLHYGATIQRLKKMIVWYEVTTRKIYKCIIPKGSEYYEDGTGLGITNQLIVVEELKEES